MHIATRAVKLYNFATVSAVRCLGNRSSCPPFTPRHSQQLPRRESAALSNNSFGQHPDLLQVAIESRGLTREQYEQGMQELLLLLPSLKPRFARLSPHLLVGLAENPAKVAQKLAELKELFPSADVFRIVNRRPALLLDLEFSQVTTAVAKLDRIFPDADIGQMVEQQPLLLVEDIDEAIEDLKRLLPSGLNLQWQLLNSPDILLSIQRGSEKLGPGAEF